MSGGRARPAREESRRAPSPHPVDLLACSSVPLAVAGGCCFRARRVSGKHVEQVGQSVEVVPRVVTDRMAETGWPTGPARTVCRSGRRTTVRDMFIATSVGVDPGLGTPGAEAERRRVRRSRPRASLSCPEQPGRYEASDDRDVSDSRPGRLRRRTNPAVPGTGSRRALARCSRPGPLREPIPRRRFPDSLHQSVPGLNFCRSRYLLIRVQDKRRSHPRHPSTFPERPSGK